MTAVRDSLPTSFLIQSGARHLVLERATEVFAQYGDQFRVAALRGAWGQWQGFVRFDRDRAQAAELLVLQVVFALRRVEKVMTEREREWKATAVAAWKKDTLRLRLIEHAISAQVAQRVYRGHRGRLVGRKRRRARDRKIRRKCAKEIQRVARGWLVRHAIQRKRRGTAALAIQKMRRGQKGRRMTAALMEALFAGQRGSRAASIMQRFARSSIVRLGLFNFGGYVCGGGVVCVCVCVCVFVCRRRSSCVCVCGDGRGGRASRVCVEVCGVNG